MKKLIIAAAFCLGLSASGFAQERNQRPVATPEERAKRMTEAMEKKLALTEDQKAKIYNINLERAKEMEKMKAENEKIRAKQMEERKEIMEDSDKKMLRILNADQKKTYEEMKANMKDRGMKNHPGMRDHKKMRDNSKMKKDN